MFGSEYPPTSLHRLLARVARCLAEAGLPQLLVVTTNYDDLVEKALAEEGLEFDLVWYEARSRAWPSAASSCTGRRAGSRSVWSGGNAYAGLPMELERPVVLKLHGCVNRGRAGGDATTAT